MITIPLTHGEALHRMYVMQLEFDHVEMQNGVCYEKVRPVTFAVSF